MHGQLSFICEPAARRTDPETSHLAADQAKPRASAGRLTVLRLLAGCAMTDFELASISSIQQTSIGKRRGECRDMGLVEAALDGRGEEVRRPSPTGSPAMVWQITAKGRAFLEEQRKA